MEQNNTSPTPEEGNSVSLSFIDGKFNLVVVAQVLYTVNENQTVSCSIPAFGLHFSAKTENNIHKKAQAMIHMFFHHFLTSFIIEKTGENVTRIGIDSLLEELERYNWLISSVGEPQDSGAILYYMENKGFADLCSAAGFDYKTHIIGFQNSIKHDKYHTYDKSLPLATIYEMENLSPAQ